MTRALAELLLFGAATGFVSVVIFFLSRKIKGVLEPRFFQNRSKKRRRRKTGRKRGGIRTFLLDFLFCILFGSYLVLYDATVLFGRGRPIHLGAFFCGFFLVRKLFLSLLYRQTESLFTFLYDLIGETCRCLFYPIGKTFAFVFSILFRTYLILKRENDKIKTRRKGKRTLARKIRDAQTAFLPAAATEALVSGRE